MTSLLPASVRGQWTREWRRGSGEVLHARPMPDPPTREVSVLSVDDRAVVLGSAQPLEIVDPEAAARLGVETVRRRGGGGAVWLAPGEQLWIDVVVPKDDELWDDDVGRAFLWLGDVWAAALRELGVDAVVHRHGLVRSAHSSLICFAGLGPGEVHVGGAKLVGMSQRRVRGGARFQCVVYDHYAAGPLLDTLSLDTTTRRTALAELAATCVGLRDVDPSLTLDRLEASFLRLLA
ncbi:MAG: hypothetical protein AAGA17_01055 [Actinomycetota bacterium]